MDRERRAGSVDLEDKFPYALRRLAKGRAIGNISAPAWHQQPVERLEQRLDFSTGGVEMNGRRTCPGALDELDV